MARGWRDGFRRAASLLTLTPFETSAAAGRANERYRRIVLTAAAAAAAKGVAILTALVSVPLTVSYLGPERYGLWMTIASVVAVLQFADLGLGNGLLNSVSEANGRDDREMASRYVSSGFFLLTAVSIILGAIFLLLYPSLPWQRIFNVSSPVAVAEAGPAVAMLATTFLISIPLGIIQRVQMGYQEGFTNSLWAAAGNLLGLAGVLIAIRLKAGLPWLVLAMAGAPAVASLLNGAVLFGAKCPWLRPRLSCLSASACTHLLRLGFLFFVLQIAVGVAFSSDNIIVAQLLGQDAVAQYSVAARMFSFAPMVLSMVLMPLWPAYGESLARGDMPWVRSALRRSLLLSVVVVALPSVLLIVAGPLAMELWVGPTIAVPSKALFLGLGVWTTVMSVGNAVAMLLNGAGIVRFQVLCAVPMTVAAVLAKIILTRLVGLPGIVWGTLAAYLLFAMMPYAIVVPRLLAGQGGTRPEGAGLVL